jgi:hypothetical protein
MAIASRRTVPAILVTDARTVLRGATAARKVKPYSAWRSVRTERDRIILRVANGAAPISVAKTNGRRSAARANAANVMRAITALTHIATAAGKTPGKTVAARFASGATVAMRR